jgi:protocatechuate 3,4-dioxygenase beta subunit
VLLTSLGTVVFALGGEAVPQPAGSGLIAGRVVDATSNQPIAGVTVSLRSLSGVTVEAQVDANGRVTRVTRPPNPSVITDSQGRFAFSALPPGGYSVMPQRPGFTPTGSAFVELADAERKIDVPLVMGRRSSISGAVRDDVGDPVVGAVVMVFLRTTMGGDLS